MASVDYSPLNFISSIPDGYSSRINRVHDALINLEAAILMSIPEKDNLDRITILTLEQLKRTAQHAYKNIYEHSLKEKYPWGH